MQETNGITAVGVSLGGFCARFLMLLGVLTLTLACDNPTATPTPAAPVGDYDCYGHEAGMLAYTGLLRLEPGGEVHFRGSTGSWTYDAATQTFEFAGETPLARAEYNADRIELSVELQPGVNISHAELGTMTCNLHK
jgi:hypothetical protein